MAAAFFVCRQVGLEVTSAGASASTVVVSSSGIEVSAWYGFSCGDSLRVLRATWKLVTLVFRENEQRFNERRQASKRGFGIACLFLGYSAQT